MALKDDDRPLGDPAAMEVPEDLSDLSPPA